MKYMGRTIVELPNVLISITVTYRTPVPFIQFLLFSKVPTPPTAA
jgi:hypothetical protein